MEESTIPVETYFGSEGYYRIIRLREGMELVSRMEHPMTIEQLAKHVQLSEWKLKHGFNELFGTTLYAYLRDYRLEQALTMMERELLSVSEAAYAVGYSNLSHFAEAFRKKYGMNPSDYRNSAVMERRTVFFGVAARENKQA